MTESTQPKQSPLHDRHLAAKARMVTFAGWNMPIQYKGIMEEHRAVRESVGIFDISHMGEFLVEGSGGAEWLDTLLTNRVGALQIGEGQYTFMLNERAGVIDDLLIYRIAENAWFLVVNASKIEEDFAWLKSKLPDRISLQNQSPSYAGMAVQGPDAAKLFSQIFAQSLPSRSHIAPLIENGKHAGFVARTGYTGEDGFELFVPADSGTRHWDAFVAAGATPAGLGARDTLRLEMCYPLNGSDLSPDRTPLEAGLGFFVQLDKEFTGSSILEEQKRAGVKSRLAAIEVKEKSPPLRSHYPVLVNGQMVGETTSGALSPSLGYGIAMAYLPRELASSGTSVEIEIRGRKFSGVVVKKPFFKRK